MPLDQVNLGTGPDGTGADNLYQAFTKMNATVAAADAAAPRDAPTFTGPVTLAPGSATGGPLVFRAGPLRASVAAGEMEFNAGVLHFCPANGSRKALAFTDGSITGNAANVTGTVAVANGGTGAAAAGQARANLGAAPTASPAFTGRASVGAAALTPSATVALNAALANVFTLALGANATLANPTGLVEGLHFTVRIRQDGAGGRTLAYGTAWKFSGGAAPALSTAANALDILSCHSDGTNVYAVLTKDFK